MTAELVFTYGMLLREAERPAALDGWRLAFDGHATIEPVDGARVHGGIIPTDARGLRYYDGIEGVNPGDPSSLDGYYRRIPVRLTDGTYAWVYVMNRLSHDPLEPTWGYVDLIRQGYRRFGYDEQPVDEALSRIEVTA